MDKLDKKILLFILLTNIVLDAVSYQLGLNRPIINIDYLIVYLGFLSFKFNKWLKALAIALILILSIIDILLIINQVFPFVQVGDLFYLSTFIFTGPVSYQKWVFIGVFYLIFIYFLTSNLFFTSHEKLGSKKAIAYLLVCIAIVLLNLDTIRSQSLFFITNYNKDFHKITGNNKLLAENKYQAVSNPIFSNIEQNKNSDKILLIVNESWGKAANQEIQKALLKPLYNHQQDYEYIDDGGFSFVGATVSGELRELCQKNATVMDISKVSDKEFNNCLPELLRKKGYQTYAVHGASGSLYDRYRWYSLVGFDKALFKEDFPKARDCKSFSGKCDYDLFDPIANILADNEKVLLYWMTLNTHTPYDDYLFIDGFDCKKLSLKIDGEACLNFKQQYQFFYRLSEYVQDDRMKGVEVFVVGDHAPPIVSLKDNFSVFEDFDVSWVKFKIK